MRNTKFLILLVLITLAIGACRSSGEGEFSIYLPAQRISAHEMSKIDLAGLELEDKPILSASGILAYSRKTHEIELTASAYERIGRLQVPVSGIPFVVCVGRDPIYGGAFWTPASSLSYDDVVIFLPFGSTRHAIQIRLGYPSSAFFTGSDPRSDRRILRSLRQAGKLR